MTYTEDYLDASKANHRCRRLFQAEERAGRPLLNISVSEGVFGFEPLKREKLAEEIQREL
jgi:hypothetical protein